MTWFEDVAIGGCQELGSHTFEEDEMIAFARLYDPQPFHVDPEAAKQSVFGGLIASGWMTVAVWMKLMSRHRAGGAEGPAISPGFEGLRWHRPVRPGVTLHFTTEVIDKRELKSRPRFGLVMNRNLARDGDGALYMTMISKVLRERRDASP